MQTRNTSSSQQSRVSKTAQYVLDVHNIQTQITPLISEYISSAQEIKSWDQYRIMHSNCMVQIPRSFVALLVVSTILVQYLDFTPLKAPTILINGMFMGSIEVPKFITDVKKGVLIGEQQQTQLLLAELCRICATRVKSSLQDLQPEIFQHVSRLLFLELLMIDSRLAKMCCVDSQESFIDVETKFKRKLESFKTEKTRNQYLENLREELAGNKEALSELVCMIGSTCPTTPDSILPKSYHESGEGELSNSSG